MPAGCWARARRAACRCWSKPACGSRRMFGMFVIDVRLRRRVHARAKPPVPQVNASNAVIVPSFLPPTLIFEYADGRLPGDHLLGRAIQEQLHRACRRPSCESSRADDRPGIRIELAAEAAADVVHLDFDVVGGHLQRWAPESPAYAGTFWVEGQTMIWSPILGSVPGCHWITWPCGSRQRVVDHRNAVLPFGDGLGFLERLVGVALTLLAALLGRALRPCQVVVVHEVRQHFVIDLDLAGGLARDLFGGGRNGGDFPSLLLDLGPGRRRSHGRPSRRASSRLRWCRCAVTRACACGQVR